MFVNILCYVYPGIHMSGVGVVYVVGDTVRHVAVGSVPNPQIKPLLGRMQPTEMVVATDKFFSDEHTRVAIPPSVVRFTIAKPGWDKLKIPLEIDGSRTHGAYVHNVYKILFRDIISRSVSMNHWNVEWFDREWVLEHAPKERRRGR